MRRTSSTIRLMVALAAGAAISAQASMVRYEVDATDPLSNNPVDVSAEFSLDAGLITLTLTNLLVGPRADNQNMSGIFFTTADSLFGASLVSATGQLVTVASNGSYTPTGSTNLTAWHAAVSGNGISLTMLGSEHARQTIIGAPNASNLYSGANSSIDGSVHNPFVFETARFVFSSPAITEASMVTGATASFGTSAGDSLAMTRLTNAQGTASVPEPGTFLSICLPGLVLLLVSRYRGRYVTARIRNSRMANDRKPRDVIVN